MHEPDQTSTINRIRIHEARIPREIAHITRRGPVRGGRFPAFRGNISIFPAFHSFFSNFRISATSYCLFDLFRFSTTFIKSFPVSTNIFKFSGFPWLENGFFRFPPEFPFPVFRRLFWPFPVFRHFFRAFPPFRHISYTPSTMVLVFDIFTYNYHCLAPNRF